MGEDDEGDGEVSRRTEAIGCEALEDDPGAFRFGIGGGGEAVDVPPFPEPSDEEGVDAADEEEAIFFLVTLYTFLRSNCLFNKGFTISPNFVLK